MSLTNAQLRVAVTRYESDFVKRRISYFKKLLAVQIGYHLFLLVCSILTLRPNFVSMLGTLGLGGFGVKANSNEARAAWQTYMEEQRIIKDGSYIIHMKLDLAGEDPDRLKEVEELLMAGPRALSDHRAQGD